MADDLASIKADIEQLRRELSEHKTATTTWQDGLQGDGNIRVEGGQIVLSRVPGTGSGGIPFPFRVVVVKTIAGTPTPTTDTKYLLTNG